MEGVWLDDGRDDGGCGWLLAGFTASGYVCWWANRGCEESETGMSNAVD